MNDASRRGPQGPEGPHEPGESWRDYTDLKRTLKALGDVVRLNIVHTLAAGDEITVTDLAQTLLISQPLVSWHLTILRHAGLVTTRRAGRLVYCSLDMARCRQTVALLSDVFDGEEDEPEAGGQAGSAGSAGRAETLRSLPPGRPQAALGMATESGPTGGRGG